MTNTDANIEAVMRQALAGDKRAYAAALEYCVRILRPYLSRRVADKAAIEDLLQEILISIHKARHTYDAMRPFAPWVFAIAHYRLKDFLRVRYKDRLHYAADISEMEISGDMNVTESSFTYESIREEVRLLPQKQASILELMHSEGYTAKEVAQRLGMTESAVKVAAHRAYKVLKTKLENK
jgi:RNA polymerase sigma-70 factor, ECF subfamily